MQVERHSARPMVAGNQSTDLADILERVLDKGIVVAGDIAVNLLDIELLTIKVRLLIASADTAKEMGIDWWEHDPFLTGDRQRTEERSAEQPAELNGHTEAIEGRLERIESALEALVDGQETR